jgi:hypothetical protein
VASAYSERAVRTAARRLLSVFRVRLRAVKVGEDGDGRLLFRCERRPGSLGADDNDDDGDGGDESGRPLLSLAKVAGERPPWPARFRLELPLTRVQLARRGCRDDDGPSHGIVRLSSRTTSRVRQRRRAELAKS